MPERTLQRKFSHLYATFFLHFCFVLQFVYLSHEKFPKHGAWAIIPIIEDIHRELIRKNTKWLIVLEPASRISLEHLLVALAKEDFTKVRVREANNWHLVFGGVQG